MDSFVPQQQAWIVERMGKFHRILEPGLAILVPFIDKIQYVKSLKEAAIEIPSQSAITADNVTLDLDVSFAPHHSDNNLLQEGTEVVKCGILIAGVSPIGCALYPSFRRLQGQLRS